MGEGLSSLSDREKETLRLLLGGHDAKSIARRLGLSVHTVNERLRDARRKLGVGTSREAARRLAEGESIDPHLLVDKTLGVARKAVEHHEHGHPDRRRSAGWPLVWFSGGMLIMSLIIAAAILSSVLPGGGNGPSSPAAGIVPAAASPVAAASPGAVSAGAWVLLLDRQQWDESWNAAGLLFRSQMPKGRWAATIQPVRQPLGAIASRTLQGATKTSSLPGLPPGDYEVVEFRTNFANKRDAIETVVLAREGAGWKVNGYFIR